MSANQDSAHLKIDIVGSGFVGQATGKGLAHHGHSLTFVDTDPSRVAAMRAQGFRATKPEDVSDVDSDLTMFCVPTPTVNGAFQLDPVYNAVESFAKRLRGHSGYHVAVMRSTVPPTTTREVVIPLIETVSGKTAGRDFGVVMQPEYLREVHAEQDFARPWLILIGELDQRSGDVVDKVYRDFGAPIRRVSLEEAEFQKYVHNSFNAVKIAFFNEMRIVAHAEGWDGEAVLNAVAESCEGIWNPLYGVRDFGPFDGSCLPKDTAALVQWGDQHGFSLGILRAVVTENLRHQGILGKNRKVRNNVLETVVGETASVSA